MSDKPPHRDPLLPGWMKSLLAVAVLFLLAVGVVSLLGTIATNKWHRYAAELRAGGDPLTLEEIEAQRATVSEEQNGARVIERLAEELSGVRTAADPKALFVFNRNAPGNDFFKGIDKSRIEPSRAFLGRYRDTLTELAALRDKPRGQFDIQYDRNPMWTRVPQVMYVSAASKLLMLDGTMQLIDSHVGNAADTAILLFHLAGTLHDEPILISRLRQVRTEDLAIQAIEHTLRVGVLGEASLTGLIAAVNDRLANSTLRWAFLGERAGFAGICEEIAQGRYAIEDFMEMDPRPVTTSKRRLWLSTMRVRANQQRGTEMYTWLVDTHDDRRRLDAALGKFDAAFRSLSDTEVIVESLLGALDSAVGLHWEAIARLRCATAGLAAERFRLDNGRFPDSLDALVPRYLDAVPIDPFDQQPMRMAVNEDGIVIYSVGPEGMDDDGDVATGEQGRHPPDRGFRLLKPHLRGLVILDDSTEPG